MNRFNLKAGAETLMVSGFTFWLYQVFVIDYFIRVSVRIPGVAVVRPTLIMVVIISLLLIGQAEKLRARFGTPSARALKIFLIYALLTLPFVSWPGSVIRNNLPVFIKAIVFFYFTLCIVDSPERLKKFLIVFIGCQLFRVMEPLFLHVTTGYWGDRTYMGMGEYAGRLAGGPYDIINANELGFVIVTIIPFLHYLLMPVSRFWRLVYFALLPALLYALVLTMSRGSFVALLVVGVFIFARSRHKVLLLIVVVGLAVGAWSQMSDVQKDRYLSLTGADVEGARTASGRVHGVEREFELSMQRPIFGHGIGTTAEAKFHYFGVVQAAHNLYAEIIIEMGIIGLILFLRFLISAYRNLNQIQHADFVSGLSDGHQLAWIGRLVSAMQVVFWMYLVYSFNYWGLSNYYWYLFCGLSSAILLLPRTSAQSDEGNVSEKRNRQGAVGRPLAGRRHS